MAFDESFLHASTMPGALYTAFQPSYPYKVVLWSECLLVPKIHVLNHKQD